MPSAATASHWPRFSGQCVCSNTMCEIAASAAVARQNPATASVGTSAKRRDSDRIDRPGEGRDEGRGEPGQMAPRERDAAPREQQHRAGERDQRARDVMRAQALARQQRGEKHDQQRPEIADKLRLGRRRKAQREEIQRVIAEQPADAERPHRPWLLQRARRARPEQPRRGADPAANRECHRGELKRRHGARRNGQQREQRPHQDRREADEGGCGIKCHRRRLGCSLSRSGTGRAQLRTVQRTRTSHAQSNFSL